MLTDKTWEEETLALIDEAKKEERRAEQRVASAEKARVVARHNREALERSASIYRRTYGVQEEAEIDPALAAEFRGKSLKEMLVLWANKYGGRVVMNDIATFLTAANLFRDRQSARGSLYSSALRSPDFERVDRGIFQRTKPAPDPEQENGQKIDDGWLGAGADSIEKWEAIEHGSS